MDALRVVEYLIKNGLSRKQAEEYVDVLVGVFWGQLKTAY